MFLNARIKDKKLVDVLGQVRMVCLLVYIIGAILFLLKYYNIINKNLNIESNWLISVSVTLFLVLSTLKLIICAVKSENSSEKIIRIVDDDDHTKEKLENNKVNKFFVLRCVSNIVFANVCIVTASLLLLHNFSVLKEKLFLDVYGVVLTVGMSLAGLYFMARFLCACLGMCSNLFDNLGTKCAKYEATDFVISQIAYQVSMSYAYE